MLEQVCCTVATSLLTHNRNYSSKPLNVYVQSVEKNTFKKTAYILVFTNFYRKAIILLLTSILSFSVNETVLLVIHIRWRNILVAKV
jgi:hypothetical protein